MAKASYIKVMMVPEDNVINSPTRYYATKPTRGLKASEKLRMRKYDPAQQKHVYFVEKKLPNPKAR